MQLPCHVRPSALPSRQPELVQSNPIRCLEDPALSSLIAAITVAWLSRKVTHSTATHTLFATASARLTNAPHSQMLFQHWRPSASGHRIKESFGMWTSSFAFPFPSQSFTFIRASCNRQPCLLGKKVLSSCPLNLFSFCFLFYVGFCSVLSSILGLSFPFSWAARGCELV